MYVSMNPKGETGKVIHISQNDTNREVEFIPYDQNGLTPLTDGQLTARINSIKGNTVSFNQLVSTKSYSNSQTDTRTYFQFLVQRTSPSVVNIISERIENTGIYERIVTPTVNTNYYFKHNGLTADLNFFSLPLTANHKYFISFNFTGVLPNVVGGLSYTNAMIMDLTLMDIDNLTTTAQVEAWLSSHIGNLPYYDYTQGTLIPFMGTGLKTVGFNQWDEELTHKFYWGDSSGYLTKFSHNDRSCSTNFVSVFPSTAYCITKPSGFDINIWYAEADGRIISSTGWNSSTSFVVTTPSNATRLAFTISKDITYNNDICVNISDALKNGTYEPYTSNTLSLPTLTYFPSGMKSAGSVYDELSDKAYTRIGSVDLGTLSWNKNVDGQFYTTYAFADAKSDVEGTNVICSKYINGNAYDGSVDKTVCIYNRIWIKDSNYTNSTTFKNSLDGIYLYYELATYTETDISLDLTYPVWNGGTEQILPVNGSTPTTAPIKANITYPDRTEDTEFLYKQTSFEWIYKSWAFVCKNITQALSVVGNALKGTIPGTMTSESGKFPLKVKMTDNDGVCFSEKLDLFVERKP